MRFLRLTLLVSACAVLAALAFAGPALAAATYTYDVDIRDALYNGGTAQGQITVRGLNTGQTATLRVTHGGVETHRTNTLLGATNGSVSGSDVVTGDVIEVYQPAIPVGPPGVAPVESFTIPSAQVTSTPGATALSGNAPSGMLTVVHYASVCSGVNNDDFTVTPVNNAFSVPVPFPLAPGVETRVLLYPGQGDRVTISSRLGGETPCLQVDAQVDPQHPGVPEPSEPYSFYIWNIVQPISGSTRVVASRGGNVYFDNTQSTTNYYSKTLATPPQPGDKIDIYRPAAAPAPSASYTIPHVSATFDPATDQVAVDGDALTSIDVDLEQTFSGNGFTRFMNASPAGRRLFNFAAPGTYDDGADIVAGNWVKVYVNDAPNRVYYSYMANQGDLAPPDVRASLAKAFKLSSLKKKLKLSLHANETSTVNIKVALSKNLPSKSHPSAKKTTKLLTIASGKATLKPGTNPVTLKLSKAGLKALARLRGVGPKLKPLDLTVTITSTDKSGNSTTTTQKGKLKR